MEAIYGLFVNGIFLAVEMYLNTVIERYQTRMACSLVENKCFPKLLLLVLDIAVCF